MQTKDKKPTAEVIKSAQEVKDKVVKNQTIVTK
jgi:hypothetical protein